MKNRFSVLLLSSLLLTSCQIGGPYKATIPLEGGGEYTFLNKKLSQEEYRSVLDLLKKPTVDYKYKFTLERFGGEFYYKTTTGEYADFTYTDGQFDSSAYLFTSKVNRSFLTESSYRKKNVGEETTDRFDTTVSYGTFNNSLDYGCGTKYVYNSTEFYYETSSNPNIPTYYPTPDQETLVKTPALDFYAMHATSSLSYNSGSGEIINTYGIDTSSVVVDAKVDGSDYHFEDIPLFSHKLTSKHLVIEEKRRMPTKFNPADKNVIFGVCMRIESDKSYYFNTTYYYNYKTGNLDKIKGSFNTLSTRVELGAEIIGSYTLEHQDRTFDIVKSEHDKYFNKFLSYKGIITYRDDRADR